MSEEERIQTLNPDPNKAGSNISRVKYDQVRRAIITALQQAGQLTFTELRTAVETQLEGHFEGSISWYYTTVKLDLETRGIVRRLGSGSPQRIELGRVDGT